MIRRVLFPASLLALFLAGCGGTSTVSSTASLGAQSLPSIKPPAFIPGPLNGYSTARDRALRRPLSVIFDNLLDSRPQSGLAAASTVIETLAEGGVTRFMAIYLENDATKVGPVRSARLYFDRWAAGFHSILAHDGGNDDDQALLWKLPHVYNLDEVRTERSIYDTGTPLFWRSLARLAPHNLYTSTYKLRYYAAQHRENWSYTGASFPHKSAAALAQRGHSGWIRINWANPLAPAPEPDYDVRYIYNRTSNTYTRYMGGTPHVDSNTNRVLAPSNVVVMQTKDATADPNSGPTTLQTILIPVLGQGTAWFFRDGKVLKGIWRQRDQNAPLHFFDSLGRAVSLNPGQTWIEVVPSSSTPSWQFR